VSGLGDDPLEEPGQFPLARQRDADGDELLETLGDTSGAWSFGAGRWVAHRGRQEQREACHGSTDL
jgi:hypothetical protein